MRQSWILVALLAALASVVACGSGVGVGGDVVGGSCDVANACALGSTCVTGGDFPGGTCSVACASDRDCPMGTACIGKNGGICLLTCHSRQDCRPQYGCKDKDRVEGGKALVCID